MKFKTSWKSNSLNIDTKNKALKQVSSSTLFQDNI